MRCAWCTKRIAYGRAIRWIGNTYHWYCYKVMAGADRAKEKTGETFIVKSQPPEREEEND